MIIYDIACTVENIGFGQVFNIALSDSPAADGAFQRVDCTDPSMVLGTGGAHRPFLLLGRAARPPGDGRVSTRRCGSTSGGGFPPPFPPPVSFSSDQPSSRTS
jgi:hypothetical protein